MLKTEDIRIRDPFVLVHDGCYYLYGSIDEYTGKVLRVHKSYDLENWEEPKIIYTLEDDSWAKENLWAPEVHKYNGKFYLFVSIKGKHGLRGTEISVSDSPEGPFIPIKNGPATPINQSCIDGTLYVEDGRPYIVYSHDWPDCYDAETDEYIGEIVALELSPDLTHALGEPFLLFTSKQVPLSRANPNRFIRNDKPTTRYGSDGPFIVKLSDGRICLLWSPMLDKNYVVLGAVADSIRSEWTHIEPELFDENGGHPMVFTALDGKQYMSIHCPEKSQLERAKFVPLCEKDGKLVVSDQ